MNTLDATSSSQLTVALVVGAYAGSIHPATSHLMMRRFIPWATGHRDTRALSRLQLAATLEPIIPVTPVISTRSGGGSSTTLVLAAREHASII